METDRKELDGALRTVLSAISQRPGIPALTGVFVRFDGESASLTATDLETTATAHVAGSGEPFVALIPGKLLASVVKQSAGERIIIERIEDRAQVGKVSLKLLPEEDFPNPATAYHYAEGAPVSEPTFAGDLGAFVEALLCAESAASRDAVRPVLTGTLFRAEGGVLTLVGTDSYRLHLSEVSGYTGADRRAIVPAHGLIGEAKRERTRLRKGSGTVRVWISETHVSVTFPNGSTVTVRVIDGEYPNYEQLIPESHEGRLTFDADEMREAVRLTGLLARDTTPIRFELNGRTIVRASSPDLGEAEAVVESATWHGHEDGQTAAFNPTYFLDGLTASGASSFELRDGLRPMILRGEGRLALVMPVRMPAVAA